MNNYIILVRGHWSDEMPDDATMQNIIQVWNAWYDKIRATGNLVDPGNPLGSESKIIRKDSVTDELIKSNGDWVGGYVIIKATDMDAAVKIAQGCPILETDYLELRQIFEMSGS